MPADDHSKHRNHWGVPVGGLGRPRAHNKPKCRLMHTRPRALTNVMTMPIAPRCRPVTRRTPPPEGMSRPGCGRRRRRRCGVPAARPWAGIPCPAGRPPARGCTGGPTRTPAGTPRCAARRAAGCHRRARRPCRPGRSRRGSRSSPRRTHRPRPDSRFRSARPSACPPPGSSSSGRGNHSPPTALLRRRQ